MSFFTKVGDLASSHLSFLKQAFSDNGQPSSSRLLTVLYSLAAAFCLVFVVVKNHALPDGGAVAGLGAFSTVHYAINRVSTAFGKQDTQSSSQTRADGSGSTSTSSTTPPVAQGS